MRPYTGSTIFGPAGNICVCWHKSWAPNKKCFFGRVRGPVGRDLEELEVVKAGDIAGRERGMVCQDTTMGYDKKKVIKKMFV